MADFIDDYFVKPMQFPESVAPYNIYNTAVYALIALLAAYLIYKWLQRKKVPINAQFYYAVLPFIFFGGILRVIQDAEILPRSMGIAGMTIYPFITPGIYILVFIIFGLAFLYSRWAAKGDYGKMLRSMRDSGIGLSLVAFAILAILGFSKIGLQQITLLFMILFLAALGLLFFEVIKRKIYNRNEVPEFKNLERTTMLAQVLDGAATFTGVALGGYSEQHVLANAIFSAFGSPLAFYLIKIIFALAIIFVLRKEAGSKEEHVFILTLITIFGLAPGLRDGLRLLFSV